MTPYYEKWSEFTFDGFDNMTPEEKAAWEQKHPFRYQNIIEYIDDVLEWLRQSPWHYNTDSAWGCIIDNVSWILESYEVHRPIDLAGAEAGYCCG